MRNGLVVLGVPCRDLGDLPIPAADSGRDARTEILTVGAQSRA